MGRLAPLSLLLLLACGTTSRTAEEIDAMNAAAIERFLSSAAAGAVGTFRGSGGHELAFVGYRETRSSGGCALVFLSGIGGHAGWLDTAARRLRERGYGVYCLDRRGTGRNRENRGCTSGHAASWETLTADIALFVEAIRNRYRRVILVGSGWGGRLAMGYALERQEDLDGLVLVAPVIRTHIDPPLIEKARLAEASDPTGKGPIRLPVTDDMLVSTTDGARRLRDDPLRLTHVTARFIVESRDLELTVEGSSEVIDLPILVLLAGADRIADNKAAREIIGNSTGPLETI
ncbi:MAG: alpha/beta fold hydrolase, partial [Planctomycetota bacterium]